MLCSHEGGEYLRAEYSQLKAANREHILPCTKANIPLSLSHSLPNIINRQDGGKYTLSAHTERHISPPSSGYGTPTDMKTLGLLLRRT